MKKLYIIGARGFGREVYDLALQTAAFKNNEFEIVGYLDDKIDALAEYSGYPPIVSSAENYIPQEHDVFVCAMGTPETKKKYVEIILAKNGQFINLIHPNSAISSKIDQCQGLLIFPNVVISVDVKLGDFISIQSFSFIGHDANISNWCHINTFCSINGFVNMAESVQMYTHATVLPKFNIGQNTIIGAGSMVMKNLPENITVFGNPARELKIS